MTFEQFLVQAMGFLDALRQRGARVFYRVGSGDCIDASSGELEARSGFVARVEMEDSPSLIIELKSESANYEAALDSLRDALAMVEHKERMLARLKDLVSTLTRAELLVLQSETLKKHISELIAQRTVS